MENKSHINDNETFAKSKLLSRSKIVDLEEEGNQHCETINNNKSTSNNDSGKENHSSSISQQQEKFCFECNSSLAKSRHLINIVGQANKTWHPECFKCDVCNNQLDREVSCHIYKDKILCKQDYLKLQRDKSIKCSRCKWSISSLDWVRKAGDYVYHLACFSCDICLRQLSTGEQFTLNVVQGEKNIVRLLCRLHFAIENSPQTTSQSANNVTKPSSSSSSNSLYSSNQNYQHTQASSGNTVTTLDANEQRLSPIGQVSSSSSMFDINQTYQAEHQNQSSLNKNGQSFVNYNHGQYLLQATTTRNKSTNNSQYLMIDRNSTCNSNKNQKNHLLENQFDRHEDQLTQQLSIVDELHQHLIEGSGGCGSDASTSSSTNGSTSGRLISMSQSKSKRVRTTFTEDQLSILQTHFQIDSNPDGQDLERIATITGLSKRVTQVWFQNSRARQKKYMIKRKPSINSSSSAAVVCHSNLNSMTNNSNNINSEISTEGNSRLLTTTSALGENQHHIMETMDYKDNPRADGQQLQNNWANDATVSGNSSFRKIDTFVKDVDHSSSDTSSSSIDNEDHLILSDDDLNTNS